MLTHRLPSTAAVSVEAKSPHGLLISCLCLTKVAEDDEDLLLVESDEEGLAAEAAALAARRTFALQHDSLFGLDSQSQQAVPMPMTAESAPAQVHCPLMTWQSDLRHHTKDILSFAKDRRPISESNTLTMNQQQA